MNKRMIKTIICLLCIMAVMFTDILPVFAENEGGAQTAAKTVRVSREGEAGDETDKEAGEKEDKDDEASDEAGDEEMEDGQSERSDDEPVERMDIKDMTEVRVGNYDEWCDLALKCRLDTWSVDKHVILTDNIECNMEKFIPIPYFAGVFDGENHTVNKAAFTDEENYIGIFSKTAPTAIIRDINVIGVMKPSGKPYNIGGLVGDNYGLISNCRYEGYVEGYDYIGGIAGYNEASGIISACSVTGKVTGLHYVGGICGANAGLVTGCDVDADINTITKEVETSLSDIKVEEVFTSLINLGKEEEGKRYLNQSTSQVDIGGIVGHNTGEISNCLNRSKVGYEHVGYNVGGIAGRQSGYLHDCTNRGYIQGRKDVGGITGQAEPYIRLDLNADIIAQLGKSINKLHDSIDKTIQDTNSSSGTVSARLNVIKDFADRALGDTGYLASSTTDFVNGVVGTTNELVDRLDYVLDETSKDGGPLDDIGNATDDIIGSVDEIEDIADDLDIENYMDDEERERYENAKTCLSEITKEHAGYFKSKYDEKYPEYYDKKYYQILTGSLKPPKDRPSPEDIERAEQGKTEEELGKAKNAAEAFAAAEATSDAESYAREQYENNHEGHTYEKDVEEYTDIIVTAILDHSDDIADNVDEDGAEALEKVRSMGENLKKSTTALKSVIGEVAGRESVRFPQLSDEYRIHTSSLVANIQGMSDNMGFLNAEMRGATDSVCKDLEGVNDQFSSLMLLFTDAMDGALDMDYSEVFEDESNDVCEDSKDATIVGCVNTGKVYADINTGGIAGTMAQEYDFDLEGDITGVKDASKKATYRTKCVLRKDRNEAEIKGKKSYAGGICGLHEIGTILWCENFAKVSSESSDYIGGVAGRSYSTIRSSYEKGILSGHSYIGGIAGAAVDISDCVAMPTVTDSVKFTGGIAGYCDETGKLSGNVFVSDTLAGVDRISMTDSAEPVTYRDLLEREGLPEDFSRMRVTFLVDDKKVADLDRKAGSVVSPEDTPVESEIARKGEKKEDAADDDRVVLEPDQYIDWDCDEEIPVYEDMEIKGNIRRYTTTLASEQLRANKQSILLADGMFTDTDKLVVNAIPVNEPDVEEFVLAIPDDGLLTRLIRYQPPEDCKEFKVYVKTGDTYEEKECQTFGRYTTFAAEGNEVVVRVELAAQKDYRKWFIAGGVALAVLIIVIIIVVAIRVRRRRRRAGTRKKGGPAGTESPTDPEE